MNYKFVLSHDLAPWNISQTTGYNAVQQPEASCAPVVLISLYYFVRIIKLYKIYKTKRKNIFIFPRNYLK